MPIIKPIHGTWPAFGKNTWLADTATVIGQVTTGDNCTFWFNSVVRGDVNTITMGNRVNVQDGACIHCTFEKYATAIGDNVSIGHHAIVHGCTIHNNVLIGMGAIVMDGAVIHSNSIVAAGAVVLEQTVVEEGCIYAGVPAKKVKSLNPTQVQDLILRIAHNYTKYAEWYI